MLKLQIFRKMDSVIHGIQTPVISQEFAPNNASEMYKIISEYSPEFFDVITYTV